jgi:serine/threonine protein kinase
MGRTVQIFMPVYEGNLLTRIMQLRSAMQQKAARRDKVEEPNPLWAMMGSMLFQILPALEHIHSQNIIHRDIKPGNILFCGDHWAITDFGISKMIKDSRARDTRIATPFYAAPEIHQGVEQTPKVDIYALGVSVLECLVSLEGVDPTEEGWRQRHGHFQQLLNQHAPQFEPMLADKAEERPTARDLLDTFFLRPTTHVSSENRLTTTALARRSAGVSKQEHEIAMSCSRPPSVMDWTRAMAPAILQLPQMQTGPGSQHTQRDLTMQTYAEQESQHMQSGVSTQQQPDSVASIPTPIEPDTGRGRGRGRGRSRGGRSVKSGRGGSRSRAPSDVSGVSKKRAPGQRGRLTSKSANKAQALGQ